MVLHSAAHAFHDGELRLALRDLADLHDLMNHFGESEKFWLSLVPRAEELNLTRPLAYALQFAQLIMKSPVPFDVRQQMDRFAPPKAVVWTMDRLVPRVLLPVHPDRPPGLSSNATLLLYIRSHWLKMPPLMLTGHLLRKAFKRSASDGTAA